MKCWMNFLKKFISSLKSEKKVQKKVPYHK